MNAGNPGSAADELNAEAVGIGERL